MKPRTIGIILGVLAVMVLSKFLLPLPALPEISVAPEALAHFGVFPLANSLLMTLVVDVIIVVLVIMGTSKLRTGQFTAVPRGLQNFWEMLVDIFYSQGEGVDRKNIRRIFPLVATIFFFLAFANLFALVPGVGSIGICKTHSEALVNHPAATTAEHATTGEATAPVAEGAEAEHKDSNGSCQNEPITVDGHAEEVVLVPLFRAPSADLNTTLAIALVSFIFIEYYGFKDLGVGYLGKFFPFKEGAISLFVGLLEFISEFVRILSFTFRLFGNIFAGEVVLVVMAFLVPWLLPLPFYALELFVAVMQAFIFAVLTIAFISQSTTPHHADGHDEVHPEDAHVVPAH